MLLITEQTQDIQLVCEKNEAGKKSYFIEGIFMQAEKKNRNGRMYPKETLVKEVNRYNNEFVKSNRAMGELGHPEGPTVNLERVSHLIKELKTDGDNIVGKAKILDTPMGNIVTNLMNEGAQLGVSSRGMGSLKEVNGVNVVQPDFMLSTVDIVADPSAPDAFVNGIMEGKQWVWENGLLKEMDVNKICQGIKKASKRELEEEKMRAWQYFVSKL
tara:strand:- start:21590 stop:22234 length:645 start_codon:yes stop_codon:yes gene_type:complete